MIASDELKSLLSSSALTRRTCEDVLLACGDSSLHVLALAVLAKHLLPRPSEGLQRQLSGVLSTWLDGTDALDHERALRGWTGVFQVSGEVGVELLTEEGMSDRLTDVISLLETHSERVAADREALAEWLAIAASFAGAHPTLISTGGLEWAQKAFGRSQEKEVVRIAASVAIVKLSKTAIDNEMFDFILQRCLVAAPSQTFALEALAVATLKVRVKQQVAERSEFIADLCKSISATSFEKAMEFEYSMASILAHLAAYPPVLTEEQKTYEKMQQLSLKGEAKEAQSIEKEDRKTVDTRNNKLLEGGAAPALVRLLKSSSDAVKATAARGLLALAEAPGRRGMLLQCGAARALLNRASTTSAEIMDLAAAQALAKLLITANPSLALNSPAALIDALSVLARMLTHTEATPLHHFEALMALTNVSSLSPELADRLAGLPSTLDTIESFMFEAVPPLRSRAATQLACNLAGAPDARKRWSDKRAATIFLALAKGSELDEAMAVASAGALARLGAVLAPSVLNDADLYASALELIDDAASDALAMRGLVFLGETAMLDPVKARQRSLLASVQHVVKDSKRPQELRDTAKEVVKALS